MFAISSVVVSVMDKALVSSRYLFAAGPTEQFVQRTTQDATCRNNCAKSSPLRGSVILASVLRSQGKRSFINRLSKYACIEVARDDSSAGGPHGLHCYISRATRGLFRSPGLGWVVLFGIVLFVRALRWSGRSAWSPSLRFWAVVVALRCSGVLERFGGCLGGVVRTGVVRLVRYCSVLL